MIPTGELVSHLVTMCSLIVGPAGLSGSHAEVERIGLFPESCLLVDASEWGCNRPFLIPAESKVASRGIVLPSANYPEPYAFRTTPMWPLDSAVVAPIDGYAAGSGLPSCVLAELTKWGEQLQRKARTVGSNLAGINRANGLLGAPPAPESNPTTQSVAVAGDFGYDFRELTFREIYGRIGAAIDPAAPFLSDYDTVYDRELLRQPASRWEAAARTIADGMRAPIVSHPSQVAQHALASARQAAHEWSIRTGLVQRYTALINPGRTAATSSADWNNLALNGPVYCRVTSRDVTVASHDREPASFSPAVRGVLLKAAAVLDQTGLALQSASQRLSLLAVGEPTIEVDTASRDAYRNR